MIIFKIKIIKILMIIKVFLLVLKITVFINIENEDKNIRDFNNSFENKKIDFNNNLSDMIVDVFVGIGNNISIYIVEVPNETAPSIQGFAKPPA